jgi:hypothetical protein
MSVWRERVSVCVCVRGCKFSPEKHGAESGSNTIVIFQFYTFEFNPPSDETQLLQHPTQR